jgi:hypothetical protein
VAAVADLRAFACITAYFWRLRRLFATGAD